MFFLPSYLEGFRKTIYFCKILQTTHGLWQLVAARSRLVLLRAQLAGNEAAPLLRHKNRPTPKFET